MQVIPPPDNKLRERLFKRDCPRDEYIARKTQVARLRYTSEELLMAVRNFIRNARRETERNRSLFGRLRNSLTVSNPGLIDLDGQALIQLYELAKEEPPFAISRPSRYLLEIPEAEAILAKAGARL